MKKVKVIHVVEDLHVGGLETALFHMVTNLDPGRFQTRVCCLEEGGAIEDELRSKGFAIDVLGLTNFYHPFQVLSLIRYFRHHRPDIVHTHGEFASTFGRATAWLSGIPVILRHIQTKADLGWNHRLYDGLLTRLTNGAIAVSKDCGTHHVRKCHIPAEKIAIIPNGVDLTAVRNAPFPNHLLKEWGVRSNHILIGAVGRLSPIKGHKYLIRAVSAILQKYPNVYLLIIGEGDERRNLAREAEDLSISGHILFMGLRRDVPSILKALDIFVLPSTDVEGLPLSVAEAMAAGVPVVASDVGGVSEIVIKGQTGILVPPGDSNQLSTAILRLLDDPDLSRRLSRQAMRLCEKEYAVDMLTKKLEKIYEDSLSTKSKKPSMH